MRSTPAWVLCLALTSCGNSPAADSGDEGYIEDNSICDDADGDAVCDEIDQCFGNDFTGDDDADDICNDEDLCTGSDASGDSDGDGICNDLDACTGGDPGADADQDGVCDFLDLCEGDDRRGDGDYDGICGDLDQCEGDDSIGDKDEDGVCDDLDRCEGDDRSGDEDNDEICNDLDACIGDNATGDADGDGLCDGWDGCIATESEVMVLNLTVLASGGEKDLELYGQIWAQMTGEEDVSIWLAQAADAISIDEGDSWPNGGVLASAPVPALTTYGPNMVLRVALYEYDTWSAPEIFPITDVIFASADGCDQTKTIVVNGPRDMQVSVDFRIRPQE